MSFILRVAMKALGLFILANLLFGLVDVNALGRVSAYNELFPGRPRFPFGETPREAYNFSLFNLNAMFAAHEIAGGKSPDEFRVIVIGDSSVWGTLLRPEETLAGQLNAAALTAPDGRRVAFYNLGYPTLSLIKDFMILDGAKAYQPDLVIWLVTLEAFPLDKQLAVPLVENNLPQVTRLVAAYDLKIGPVVSSALPFTRSIVGQRKNLADLIRLQVYGVMWAATGVDQLYPADYPRAAVDLEADPTFHGRETLSRADLAFDVIAAGQQALGDVPLIVVNEPILISAGENSAIRYNFYYPRQAYDPYRQWLGEAAQTGGYTYLDAWDIVPPIEFTNSAIHLNAQGTGRLAEAVRETLENTFMKGIDP